MPEVISKYPEITIKVLKEAGLRCGEGAPQKILTKCPPERFCQAPTGEVCVYGLDEIEQAAQISREELFEALKTQPLTPTNVVREPSALSTLDLSLIILIAGVGSILGFLVGKRSSASV